MDSNIDCLLLVAKSIRSKIKRKWKAIKAQKQDPMEHRRIEKLRENLEKSLKRQELEKELQKTTEMKAESSEDEVDMAVETTGKPGAGKVRYVVILWDCVDPRHG